MGLPRRIKFKKPIATKKVAASLQKQHTTLGFMQVGLDIVTSANCKSQLQFQLDEFQSAAVMGRRNTISQPA